MYSERQFELNGLTGIEEEKSKVVGMNDVAHLCASGMLNESRSEGPTFEENKQGRRYSN